mmetsp:Transcript_28685/g.80852  ORF Transcript_28685/g.80852 Transcript_28685/m.80852 type:complete len:220 (+) Transcript_28685:463-1122(+)
MPPFVNVRYSVRNMEPRYMVVKNIRSGANMPFRCSMGPVNIPKLPMNINDPHVKDSANFCGFNAIVGNPTKNAKAKNNAERNSMAQKTWNRCWYPIPKIFFGICASMLCFMLSKLTTGMPSVLNDGICCSKSNHDDDDELVDPFSSVFCSSYHLPNDDDMVLGNYLVNFLFLCIGLFQFVASIAVLSWPWLNATEFDLVWFDLLSDLCFVLGVGQSQTQ